MKYRSNNCIAIHLTDLAKAEIFYSQTLGFQLKKKTNNQLEYDTGHFLLYINKDSVVQLPIPSFTVKNVKEAKQQLQEQGCTILEDRGDSLYFQDPFGIVYDIIEGEC